MGAFDIQVNGYGGVDFNHDDLRPDDLHRACEALARDGVESILATIITEDIDSMALRIRQIVRMRESDEFIRQMVAGIHVEGPYTLNRWTVTVREYLAAWTPNGSHLVGSALSMPRVLANLSNELALEASHIAALTKTSPRVAVDLL